MDEALSMRWPWVALLALGLGACQPMTPSGDPFAPVAAVEEAAETTAAAQPVAEVQVEPRADDAAPADAANPDADPADPFAVDGAAEVTPAPSADESDPLALQAVLLGKPLPDAAVETPAPPPPAAQAPLPADPAASSLPVWDPERPLPEATFGVRVLSTLSHLQPPRAVLGLPDGGETVVQAGTILPDEHVIVMAIGRDVVQLARVVPQGYFARIETQNVQALFPTERGDGGR